jgi:hypothetical protein
MPIAAVDRTNVTFGNTPIDIAVDNCCSNSISNDLADFVDMRPYQGHTEIEGIGGSITIKGVGTVVWNVTDDEGETHAIRVSDVWYSEDASLRLLCPQQLAVQQADKFQQTGIFTGANGSIFWFNGTKMTIPHSPSSNIPIIRASAHQYDYEKWHTAFTTLYGGDITVPMSPEPQRRSPSVKFAETVHLKSLNGSIEEMRMVQDPDNEAHQYEETHVIPFEDGEVQQPHVEENEGAPQGQPEGMDRGTDPGEAVEAHEGVEFGEGMTVKPIEVLSMDQRSLLQ